MYKGSSLCLISNVREFERNWLKQKNKKSQDKWEEKNPYGPNVHHFDRNNPFVEEEHVSKTKSSLQLGKRKERRDMGHYFAPRTTPRA